MRKFFAEIRARQRKRLQQLFDYHGAGTCFFPNVMFVVMENFKVNMSDQTKPHISYISSLFKKLFFGKTEQYIQNVSDLFAYTLVKPVSPATIREMCAELHEETFLYEIFPWIKDQIYGAYFLLCTYGCSNIFYVRDKKGFMRLVDVYRKNGSWKIRVLSDKSKNIRAGSRIVIHKMRLG